MNANLQVITFFELIDDAMKYFEELPSSIYPSALLPLVKHYLNPSYFKKGIVIMEEGEPKARIAIFENENLKYNGAKAAMLGGYECVDDNEVSEVILKEAILYCKQEGYTQIIGPIDGSTWHSYRFLTTPNPPFFTEPYHHFYYKKQWEDAGFKKLEQYASYKAPLSDISEEVRELENRFESRGIQTRRIDQERFEEELEGLYEFTDAAFQKNFLYTPIDKATFFGQYRQLQNILHPDMVWLAHEKEKIVGLIVAYPDYLDASGKTMIVKTLARRPGFRYGGIGRLLTAKVSQLSYEANFTHAIHALMRMDNASIKVSERMGSELYQEYSLYHLDI